MLFITSSFYSIASIIVRTAAVAYKCTFSAFPSCSHFVLSTQSSTREDYHRLNGSSSPVLTATCLSYGSLCDFIFFLNRPGGHTHRPILTQNGSNDMDSRKDVPFGGKNCNFLKPLTLRPPKPPKFAQFWSGLCINFI